MRISDWSSDVCSSDLHGGDLTPRQFFQRIAVDDLCAAFLHADRGAEIDLQLERGLACFREGFGLDDRADTDVDAEKIVEGDGIGCGRSEEHTSELQSLMRISYAVFCLKKKNIRPALRYERV